MPDTTSPVHVLQDQDQAMQNYQEAVIPGSPTSSSSTLALEDEEIKNIFLVEKPDITLPSTPEDALDPRAAPFVPQVPKSRRLLRPVAGKMLQPRISKWLRTFNRATTAPIGDVEVFSLIVVNAEAWMPEPMAELGQVFCWRAAEASLEDLEVTVTFAEILYLQFRKMKSQQVADWFVWYLKEFVVGTFISVWDVVSFPECCVTCS